MSRLTTLITLLISVVLFNVNTFAQSVTLDSCNFETTCPILNLDTSSSNIWEIGTPSKTIFDSAYSVTNALITDSLNYYPINNHSSFILIPTDNNGDVSTDNMYLEFNYKIDSDTLLDGGYIEVSYDYGQSWYNVIDEYQYNPFSLMFFETNLYQDYDTLYNGETGISGSTSEWKKGYIKWIWSAPIKSYTIDTLMIRFNFISDSIDNNKEGWMIDDLTVSYEYLSSINSNNQNVKFKAYPSPAQNFINIELTEIRNFENVSIQLIDNLGKVVLSEPLQEQNTQLSVEHLAKGIYQVLLLQADSIISKSKVVKE
jgi:hypothetical protein